MGAGKVDKPEAPSSHQLPVNSQSGLCIRCAPRSLLSVTALTMRGAQRRIFGRFAHRLSGHCLCWLCLCRRQVNFFRSTQTVHKISALRRTLNRDLPALGCKAAINRRRQTQGCETVKAISSIRFMNLQSLPSQVHSFCEAPGRIPPLGCCSLPRLRDCKCIRTLDKLSCTSSGDIHKLI